MAIKVLIVDDSPFFREVLRDQLDADPSVEVVGEAGDGSRVVAMVEKLQPDVVTMDVVMPMVGGIDAIREVMRRRPTPIVVLATSSGNHERLALEAVGAGAFDMVAKPRDGFGAKELSELVALLRAAARATMKPVSSAEARQSPPRSRSAATRFVGVVSSTGGPSLLRKLLSSLPRSFSLPVAVVQHTVPGFSASLASWLDDSAHLRVRLAVNGGRVEPGDVVIAPDGAHLHIDGDGCTRLLAQSPVDGHRPSGSVLLTSIARSFGAGGMGIVLTGMGRDGANGLVDIEKVGGVAVVQDFDTAAVDGMPRAAAAATKRAWVLSPDAIGRIMVERAMEASK